MFIGTCTGMVSATSCPPSSAARSPADSWRGTRSGSRESTVSTFQFSGRLAAALTEPSSSISSSENWSRQPCTMPSSVVPGCAPVSSLIASELFGRGPAAGDRLAVAVAVRRRLREREAERAGLERAAELGAHLGDLLGRGLAADRVGAHHVAADGAVPGEEAGVHRDRSPRSRSRYSRERLPLPVDALLERGQRHALDPRHHPAQVVGVAVAQRREREPAVAADDGGDAVHARRARGRVPQELRVVVRVRVDEAGGDDQAGGVDDVGGRLVDRCRWRRCARRRCRRRPRRPAPRCRRRRCRP